MHLVVEICNKSHDAWWLRKFMFNYIPVSDVTFIACISVVYVNIIYSRVKVMNFTIISRYIFKVVSEVQRNITFLWRVRWSPDVYYAWGTLLSQEIGCYHVSDKSNSSVLPPVTLNERMMHTMIGWLLQNQEKAIQSEHQIVQTSRQVKYISFNIQHSSLISKYLENISTKIKFIFSNSVETPLFTSNYRRKYYLSKTRIKVYST